MPSKKPAATAQDVALFMKKRLAEEHGVLYQEQVVYEIEEQFGEEFVYLNDNGNQAIGKDVLEAFRAITPDLVWERGEKCWRVREDFDEPGRKQD